MSDLAEAANRATAPSASNASSSISLSVSAAANCCPTAPIISPASCTSGRWRACATISLALGIERNEGNAEPEDHAAMLLRDHGRACRRPLPGAGRHRSEDFREASRALDRPFLRRSRARGSADFYRRVGTLGRVFIEIETEAFALPRDSARRSTSKLGGDGDEKNERRQSDVAISFARLARAPASR